jgi:hypothetical protein
MGIEGSGGYDGTWTMSWTVGLELGSSGMVYGRDDRVGLGL